MEIKERLMQARKIEPLLTNYGIGVQDTANDQETLDKAFAEIRTDHLIKVCALLANCKKTKSINRKHSSYGIKHLVERAIASYTTNGELIAAMLICGFSHKTYMLRNGKICPNADFNISEKSINWLASEDKNMGW